MFESDEYGQDARSDETLAATQGVTGVPFFVFANGARASGALPVEEFKKILMSAGQLNKEGKSKCGSDECSII